MKYCIAAIRLKKIHIAKRDSFIAFYDTPPCRNNYLRRQFGHMTWTMTSLFLELASKRAGVGIANERSRFLDRGMVVEHFRRLFMSLRD